MDAGGFASHGYELFRPRIFDGGRAPDLVVSRRISVVSSIDRERAASRQRFSIAALPCPRFRSRHQHVRQSGALDPRCLSRKRGDGHYGVLVRRSSGRPRALTGVLCRPAQPRRIGNAEPRLTSPKGAKNNPSHGLIYIALPFRRIAIVLSDLDLPLALMIVVDSRQPARSFSDTGEKLHLQIVSPTIRSDQELRRRSSWADVSRPVIRFCRPRPPPLRRLDVVGVRPWPRPAKRRIFSVNLQRQSFHQKHADFALPPLHIGLADDVAVPSDRLDRC